MRRLRFVPAQPAIPSHSLLFPGAQPATTPPAQQSDPELNAIDRVSRKLEDLARQLNCLGVYDESDPDRPRAA